MSKLYNTQGINTIKAIIIGSNIVQENNINWSKRILGKEALTHMKVNTIKLVLIPKTNPFIAPSTLGDCNICKGKLVPLYTLE